MWQVSRSRCMNISEICIEMHVLVQLRPNFEFLHKLFLQVLNKKCTTYIQVLKERANTTRTTPQIKKTIILSCTVHRSTSNEGSTTYEHWLMEPHGSTHDALNRVQDIFGYAVFTVMQCTVFTRTETDFKRFDEGTKGSTVQ